MLLHCKNVTLVSTPYFFIQHYNIYILVYPQHILTKASNTNVSNVSLSEFSIIMLKSASNVSWRNYK